MYFACQFFAFCVADYNRAASAPIRYRIGSLKIIPSTQNRTLIPVLKSTKNVKFSLAREFSPAPICFDTRAHPQVAIIIPMARNGLAMLTADSASVPSRFDTKS